MGQTASTSCPADLNLSAPTQKRSIRSTVAPSLSVKNEDLLTAHQRTLLQKSWRKAQKTGLENIGAQVFVKVYQRERSVMTLFGMHDVPHTELKYHKSFQNVSMYLIRSMDYIIANLNEPSLVTAYCRQLGKRHAQYITRGFRPEYWDVFGEALTECAIDWEGGVRCREALNGWRTLVAIVIEEMRVGFRKGKREQFDRRAVLRNALVLSDPSLAFNRSALLASFASSNALVSTEQSNALCEATPSLTNAPCASEPSIDRANTDPDILSEGANSMKDDYFDQFFRPKFPSEPCAHTP